MHNVERLRSYEQMKLLADPRRLAILRRLLAGPATLTQLGRGMQEHPAWIRHHLKLLEQAGLVEIAEVRASAGYLEKFYRARAGAFLFQELVLPEEHGPATLVFAGSHDLALELLANLPKQPLRLVSMPVGSLDGLAYLRQGLSHLAGCHLLDPENGEYNTSYVRHFFPDRPMALLTLAEREQGLLLADGNPKQVRGLADLGREDITLANRNRGSGTRLWLERSLRQAGLPPGQVRGFQSELRTHTQVAQSVRSREADVGLGIRAAAVQFDLAFIPLFQERYDLVIPEEQVTGPRLAPLLDHLASKEFRRSVGDLGGYDTTHTGDRQNS
jgi:putative molybdopterin biosynthesis protein